MMTTKKRKKKPVDTGPKMEDMFGAIDQQDEHAAFDHEPEWEDMAAMLRHYGSPKPTDWLERQMEQGLARKEDPPKPWVKLGKAEKRRLANYLDELVYQMAVSFGWSGQRFVQQRRYNDL